LPIYEFVCQQCRGLTELLVRNTKDEVEVKCSDCGSTELQRVLSSVNSVVSDGVGQGAASTVASSVEQRSCPSGNCSTITLPGHSRS